MVTVTEWGVVPTYNHSPISLNYTVGVVCHPFLQKNTCQNGNNCATCSHLSILRVQSTKLTCWNPKMKLLNNDFPFHLGLIFRFQLVSIVFFGNLNYPISNRRITKPSGPTEKKHIHRETCSCRGRAKDVRIFCAQDARDIG